MIVGSPTRDVADFIVRTQYRDLPSDVVSQAKKCLLDFIGLCLGGSLETDIRILADIIEKFGGKEEARVIGYPFMAPSPSAALVNAAMGHALQMDDGDRWTIAHLGTEIIPAALAASELGASSGRELITAIVLGYEVAMRIGYAVNPSHQQRGFCPNSTLGIFGASTAVAKILNLRVEEVLDALGSAGTQASGVEQFVIDGSASQFLNPAHAAAAGVFSALLAQRGFSGSEAILEGAKGFCRAFSDQCDFSKISVDLGEDFQITKVYFKPYPTCRAFHGAIDAILQIRRMKAIRADDVQKVNVKTYSYTASTMCNPPPDVVAAARLNMPYCLACALVENDVNIRHFTEEKIRDPQLIGAMRKFNFLEADEELNQFAPYLWGAAVTIEMKGGESFEQKVAYPRGEPENPLSNEELVSRFRRLASLRLDNGRIDDITSTVNRLEQTENVVELTRLLESRVT